jgi:hypothetical protein
VVERDEVEKREKNHIPTQLMPQQKFCNSSAVILTAKVHSLLQRNKMHNHYPITNLYLTSCVEP